MRKEDGQRNRWEHVDITSITGTPIQMNRTQMDRDHHSKPGMEECQMADQKDTTYPQAQANGMMTPAQLRQAYPNLIIEERVVNAFTTAAHNRMAQADNMS